MKCKLFSLVTVILILLPNMGIANDGVYFGAGKGTARSSELGIDFLNNAHKSSLNGFELGYRVNEHFRGEFELINRPHLKYRHDDVEGMPTISSIMKIKAVSYHLNLYYDVVSFGLFTPYMTAGCGISRNKTDSLDSYANGVKVSTKNGATRRPTSNQFGIGSLVRINPALFMDISYRRYHLGKAGTGHVKNELGVIEIEESTKGRLKTKELQIGLKYFF